MQPVMLTSEKVMYFVVCIQHDNFGRLLSETDMSWKYFEGFFRFSRHGQRIWLHCAVHRREAWFFFVWDGTRVHWLGMWKWKNSRVSVQEVKSLGSHFACLCQGFEFYEVKKKCYYFSKRKWKYFYFFNHFYSEKSSKRAK